MRVTSPRDSFFTEGGARSLWIGKSSPLASDLVARTVAATMSWEIAMLWDRMWLEAPVQELIWSERKVEKIRHNN